MKEFFEIHDSTLREIAKTDTQLTLIIDAIRIEWLDPDMTVDGNTFKQTIRLDFEGATTAQDSTMTPETLLDGSFNAEKHDANPEDKLDGYLIPTSLQNAENVRLVLQGMAENYQDYVTLEIAAQSMRLTTLGEPEYLGKIPASNFEAS